MIGKMSSLFIRQSNEPEEEKKKENTQIMEEKKNKIDWHFDKCIEKNLANITHILQTKMTDHGHLFYKLSKKFNQNGLVGLLMCNSNFNHKF